MDHFKAKTPRVQISDLTWVHGRGGGGGSADFGPKAHFCVYFFLSLPWHNLNDTICMTQFAWHNLHEAIYRCNLYNAISYDAICMMKIAWHNLHDTICMMRFAWRDLHDTICIRRFAWRDLHDANCMTRLAWRNLHDAICMTRFTLAKLTKMITSWG